MSLDIDLVEKWEGEVFSKNITHNLTNMADNVPVGNNTTLYDIMWDLEDKFPNRTKAKQIAIPLAKALIYINTHEKELSEYNPENGWGSYYSLKEFVEQYLIACCTYPNARIRICR